MEVYHLGGADMQVFKTAFRSIYGDPHDFMLLPERRARPSVRARSSRPL